VVWCGVGGGRRREVSSLSGVERRPQATL
jgi:hypothetical protein